MRREIHVSGLYYTKLFERIGCEDVERKEAHHRLQAF